MCVAGGFVSCCYAHSRVGFCSPLSLSPWDVPWAQAVKHPSYLPHRIILAGMGKMQIRNPTKKEQGTYGCSVANHLGSDVESSPVLYAGNARC